MIDTLKAVKELQDSGLGQEQAEATVRLVTQVENSFFSDLVKKHELTSATAVLSDEIRDVETKLSGEIRELDTKLSARITNVETKLSGEIKVIASEMKTLQRILSFGFSFVGVVGILLAISSFFHP